MEALTCRSHEVTMKVPFFDLDPMQIVWHGNYLKYFDIARSELFDGLGVDLFEFHDRTRYIFPIIRTAVKHIHPLRRGDEFICRATVKDARSKIVVAFEIRLVADGTICARGTTEQAAVLAPEMEMVYTIPEEIRRALGF
ncbi:MAG: thioesterase family protein [Deltaproteobacteria bacterium]|nr:thioesterase family protein [Deltaproteobacteria bacterium]